MNIETLRTFCLSLPHVTEDVKWGADLCFCIGGKMFCVSGFGAPFRASFRVTEDEFEELSAQPGIIPAPYLARHRWILVNEDARLTGKQWERYIRQSYELIKRKLPKKVQQGLA